MLESNIGRRLIKAIKQNTKAAEKIHPDMKLEFDLGLDSLSRAEVSSTSRCLISSPTCTGAKWMGGRSGNWR